MLKSDSGFLLLEVSVAIIILAVGMTFVMRSFNTAISTIKNLQDSGTAMQLMAEKMFEIKKYGITKVAPQGNFADGLERFSWSIDYKPQDALFLDDVTVSVSWGKQGRRLSAETYFQQK